MSFLIAASVAILALIPVTAGTSGDTRQTAGVSSSKTAATHAFPLELSDVLPQDLDELSGPLSLCVNSDGSRIAVANTGRSEVVCFTGDGLVVWTYRLPGDLAPIGISLDAEGGTVFTAIGTDTVFRLDAAGELDRCTRIEDDRKRSPGRLAVSTDGSMYVVDRLTQEVVVVAKSGKVVGVLGVERDKEKETVLLEDVVLGPSGHRILVSALGFAVQVFDSSGTLIHKFGVHGSDKSDFSFPTAAAIDSLGRIWVVDSFQHKLKVFDETGRYIFGFGNMGKTPGNFFFPVDAVFDSEGRLYVLDKMSGRIQIFSAKTAVSP